MAVAKSPEGLSSNYFNPEIAALLESKFPGIVIDKFRELDLVEAYVPSHHIYGEDVAVDLDHVMELAEDIKEGIDKGEKSGQKIPVWLAEISDFDQLAIIDGFHRSAAIGKIKGHFAYAAISLGMTWEKVIDERIIAANMHKSVRFSRVIEWVEDAWSRSPWHEIMDASQAFALAVQPKQSSRTLSKDQLQELQGWVNSKCKDWKLKPISIYDFLSVAKIADPELVNEARASETGHRLEALTPSHLKAIAKALPNRFDIQRLTASLVIANNLTVPLARSLALKLAEAQTVEEAQEIAAPGLIDSLQPEYSKGIPGETRGRKAGAKTYGGGGSGGNVARNLGLEQAFFVDELEIASLSLKNLILSGRYTVPP